MFCVENVVICFYKLDQTLKSLTSEKVKTTCNMKEEADRLAELSMYLVA